MSFSDFKNDAKGKLDDYQPEIDAEALWADLAPQIPQQEKKRRFLLWFFLGGLVLGMGIFTYWYASQKTENSTLEQSINIAQDTKGNAAETDTKESLPPSPSSLNSKDHSPQNSESNAKNIINPDIPKQKTNSSNSVNPKNEPIASTTQKTTKNIINSTSFNPSKINSGQSLSTLEKEPGIYSTATLATPSMDQPNRILFSPFEKLTGKGIHFPLPYPADKIVLATAELNAKTEEDYRSSKKNWQWTLGLSAGGGRLDQNTTGLIDSLDPPFNRPPTNTTTETPLEELNAAVEVQLRHRNGLYFQTGLAYSRIASRFNQTSQTTTTTISPDGILRIYTNSITGDSTFVRGPVIKQETMESTKTRYNNFHAIQIPLMLGYRFEQENWAFGIEAGILANAYLKKSGTVGGITKELYDLEKDESEWFKNNLGIQPMVAMEASYRIRPNWELHLSPQYRFPVKVTTANNPVERSFSSLGLAAGVRIRL